jgi:flagellar basal-body rod protein FlgG
MSGAFYVARAGLDAQQAALDAIANNISNVNTHGYKRSTVRFAEIAVERSEERQHSDSAGSDRRQVAGVRVVATPMLEEQGSLQMTGDSFDLAIDGDGFIELLGPAGESLLWRGGRLRVLDDGRLANSDGLILHAGLTVPADARTISIARDGSVLARVGDGSDTIEVGQIALVAANDSAMIERLDGGLYRFTGDGSLTEAAAGEDGRGVLVQGAVEQSTVSLNLEMVQLLIVQRAYAANAQVIQAADQLLGLANNLRR